MEHTKGSRPGASGRGRLRSQRLTLGAIEFELFSDGRVVATLPPTTMPFGVAIQATALYPSLGAFLAAMRLR